MASRNIVGLEMADIKSNDGNDHYTSGLDIPVATRSRRSTLANSNPNNNSSSSNSNTWSHHSGDSSTWVGGGSAVSEEWPNSALPERHSFLESVPGSGPATPIDIDSRPTSPCFYQGNGSSQSHHSLAPLMKPHHTSKSTSGLSSEYTFTEDSIAHLHKRDDVEIFKGWRRKVSRFMPFLMFGNTFLYFAYLGLRIACVIMAQNSQNTIYAGAWAFLAVEILVAIPSQMHNFLLMCGLKKRQRPKLRLRGEDGPTVDVFVTCCGEDDEIVLDTVRAACDQDYPRDRFRVIVLDDGKSAGLEAYINQLAGVYENVFYIARPKFPGVPHHFKAGNLNYGLEQVDLMGPGEFMAALDADMIPERDWLRALLPHLLIDPKMALACPPQLFYNTPVSDPLAQSLNFFVHVIEPIKDALGVAWCTGSGYIFRREALTEIGNFPTGSLAEDVATSTMVIGKGWKTSYIHEPLQFGTVPEDFAGHLKQRTRWAVGTVQTATKLNFCLYGDSVRSMTVAQRLLGALYAMLGIFTVLLTLSMFVVPIVLAWGKPLVAFSTVTQLRWLIWGASASVACNRLCEVAMSSPSGYHTSQRDSRSQFWMSPYLALSIMRAFILPRWLGGNVVAFKPTGSLGSALNERDAQNRKSMPRRLFTILFNYMAIFHFVFVYFTLAAVAVTSYKVFFAPDTSLRGIFIGLTIHVFWPPMTFLFLVSSLWTPIAYAIDPPVMPEREALLQRDQKTGIAHPTEASKRIAFSGQEVWFEFLYTVSTVHTVVVFVYSFYL
ncbi:uncharacterized protein L3040_008127 [Drepanopeziza brunnea f. sp. 'multigermtubi']|uniref:uncharacterized protein n=1 Tax=Drepanopeziza brunnea f. sp. 'multigermtubi' TaxID=698441 RepID=UPI00238CED4A|nr:hypothetical protein L3040_008127 [Drepanopeziza brunnea f. sp. 'multigermtubi']